MSIQKKQKNDGESHWEREVLFSFLGPWRERGGWEGKRGWRTEKSVRSLVLEHHGPRVKQLANFWGYDAYIDDEPQRNGGKMRMSWLYIYTRDRADLTLIEFERPPSTLFFYDFPFSGGKRDRMDDDGLIFIHTHWKSSVWVVLIPDGKGVDQYKNIDIFNSNGYIKMMCRRCVCRHIYV